MLGVPCHLHNIEDMMGVMGYILGMKLCVCGGVWCKVPFSTSFPAQSLIPNKHFLTWKQPTLGLWASDLGTKNKNNRTI